MAERLNAPVLKTGMGLHPIGGSNPSLSATGRRQGDVSRRFERGTYGEFDVKRVFLRDRGFDSLSTHYMSVGNGVIGNSADFESAVLGSSPSSPARKTIDKTNQHRYAVSTY